MLLSLSYMWFVPSSASAEICAFGDSAQSLHRQSSFVQPGIVLKFYVTSRLRQCLLGTFVFLSFCSPSSLVSWKFFVGKGPSSFVFCLSCLAVK